VQNAKYWTPQIPWLEKTGKYFLVDMLGHGSSVPGASDPTVVSAEKNVDVVSAFIQKHVSQPVFLVGRSYGGKIAVEIAKKIPESIESLILIAPAINSNDVKSLPDKIKNQAVVVIAAEDDIVIPFENSKEVAQAFPSAKFVSAGKIITDDKVEKWKSHTPEMVHPELLEQQVQELLKESKL